MVAHADGKRAAISPEGRGPERSMCRISRRVGSARALKTASGDYRATLVTVSQVRVVTAFPKVFSMSVMKTGPFGFGR